MNNSVFAIWSGSASIVINRDLSEHHSRNGDLSATNRYVALCEDRRVIYTTHRLRCYVQDQVCGHSLVMDLDLDFFVSPTAREIERGAGRLESETYKCSSESEVRQFLEQRCGLSTSRKIPGVIVTHHDEAFQHWSDWIASGQCSGQFKVVHADAHADLGLECWNCKDLDWSYLLTEFLSLSNQERLETALRG